METFLTGSRAGINERGRSVPDSSPLPPIADGFDAARKCFRVVPLGDIMHSWK